MWNVILVVVVLAGLVALFAVAAVRRRRYAGDMTIEQSQKDSTRRWEDQAGGGTSPGI